MKDSFSQRGGWWVLLQAGLMLLVLVLGLSPRGEPPWPGGIAGGAALMFAGAMVAFAGGVAWRMRPNAFPKPGEDAPLLRNGIYSVLRHPLYASLILVAIGWAVFRSSWSALAAGLALTIFFDAKARREEKWLREKFPEYARYQQQVRRFIPWMY